MADQNTEIPMQICKFCKYFGSYGNYNVCYRGPLLKVALFGPEIVKYDGWCNKFVFDAKYFSNQKTR